jgi:hypothetical protein
MQHFGYCGNDVYPHRTCRHTNTTTPIHTMELSRNTNRTVMNQGQFVFIDHFLHLCNTMLVVFVVHLNQSMDNVVSWCQYDLDATDVNFVAGKWRRAVISTGTAFIAELFVIYISAVSLTESRSCEKAWWDATLRLYAFKTHLAVPASPLTHRLRKT